MTGQGKKYGWIWIAGLVFIMVCSFIGARNVFSEIGRDADEYARKPLSPSDAAHEMIDYELPPDYQEVFTGDISGVSLVKIASESNTGPIIILAQFNTSLENKDIDSIQGMLEQNSGRHDVDKELIKVEKVTLRGEDVEVKTYEGKDKINLLIREQVVTFPGKNGTVMMVIVGPAGLWDRKAMDDFIRSIH
jgi:hypothetical protein